MSDEIDEGSGGTDLNQSIDAWLAEDRPERYDPAERGWMGRTIAKAVRALKDRDDRDQVIEEAARRLVVQREGQASKSANRILRNIAESEALPLGWGEGETWKHLRAEVLSLPLSIAKRVRIRLGAISPAELEQWELENAREEDKRRIAQITARKGARLLAEWSRTQKVQRVEDLRAQKKPDPTVPQE